LGLFYFILFYFISFHSAGEGGPERPEGKEFEWDGKFPLSTC
jgi:hypothetical protein